MRKIAVAFSLLILLALSAFAQGQSAPTLRIVTDDPTLPSDLFYGDIKVKPLRLRPGTNVRITIDDSDFFVQQQYIDFLNRFPEAGGFAAWMNVLQPCNGDTNCLDGVNGKRVLVSQSFFQSQEFQIKGYYAFRFYKAALNRLPHYPEITADMRAVTGATAQDVYQKRAAFAQSFVGRAEFTNTYGNLSNAQYVSTLLNNYGLTTIHTTDPANPDTGAQVTLTQTDLTNGLNAGTLDRGKVLRAIVESQEVSDREFNNGFVAMQYYGYLRREPEVAGFNAWLTYLNAHPGDFKTMVWGFVYSQEYRNRF
jgi:hypothetical protein